MVEQLALEAHAAPRVTHALEQHELPILPVNVTLAGYDRRHRRELN